MFASERRLTVAVGVHSKAEASKILWREFWGTQDPKWLRSGVGARDMILNPIGSGSDHAGEG